MTEDMRERFEKWARDWFASENVPVEYDPAEQCYQHLAVQSSWMAWQAALYSAGTPTDIGVLAKSIVHYVLSTFARSDADHLTVDVAGQLSAFMEARLGGLQALVQQNKEMAERIQKEALGRSSAKEERRGK